MVSDTTTIREFLAFKLGAEECGIAILRVLRHDLQRPRRLVETAAHLADHLLARLLTTNRIYKQWAGIFNNDATLTSALLDRLLDHVETVLIEGKSYCGQARADA